MKADHPIVELLHRVSGVSHVDDSTDLGNAITSRVVRCVYEGRRAVAVGTSTKVQIDALLDLVDLHLHNEPVVDGTPVASDEVVLLLVQDTWDTEAEGALRTLAAQLGRPRGVLKRLSTSGDVLPISASGLDDLGDHQKYRYTSWLDLLMNVGEQPPELVQRILTAVPRSELRAYPLLTNKNWWSLRVDGLDVAQIGPRSGRVEVAKDYDGRRGPERTTWLDLVPEGRIEVTEDDASIARAAEAIGLFAGAWAKRLEGSTKHNEHALESRILRGVVPISVSSGPLELLEAPGSARVNWGSQFPTRWGRTTSNSGRYLDAVLRQGNTPWAVEIKVDGPSGVTLYYRHAVAQAVLYREFIRRATHLAPWFDRFGLDHTACQAAVVVPELRARQQHWGDRLRRVCEEFDVELVTVPEHLARAGRLPD